MSIVVDREKGSSTCHLVSYNERKHDANRCGRRYQADSLHCCLLAITLVVFGMITFSIILHQQQNQRIVELEEQVNTLKAEINKRFEKISAQQMTDRQTAEVRDKRRVKRCVCTESRPSQRQVAYQGFPKSFVAMYYGEKSELEKSKIEHPEGNGYKFENITGNPEMSSIKRCKELWQNSHQSIWCVAKANDEKDRFMLYGHHMRYAYFVNGAWMQNADSNYRLQRKGAVRVKSSGLYMIFANVQFSHETASSFGYKINMTRGRVETTLGQCVKTIPPNADRIYGTSPCHTLLIAPLESGDEVYIEIQSFVFFRVAKENLYFGLTKLTDNNF